MKTKKLTFTDEELNDIRHALFMQYLAADEEKHPVLAEALRELYLKVRNYQDSQK